MSDRAWLWLVVVILMVVLLVAMLVHRSNEREACRERGGRVIDIRGSHSAWFCQESEAP